MFAEFAVRRWQFTLVVFAALCALGGNSLVAIPKSEDPIFPVAQYLIAVVLPGAAPQDLERLVADPIETKLKGLQDLNALRTHISDGLVVIDAEFEAGCDAEKKRDEIVRETTALRSSLPTGIVRLDVVQADATKVSLVEVALVSEKTPYRELERLARTLKRRMESVKGVGDVTLAGVPKQEVRVAIDMPRLLALGISPMEVAAAIGNESQNLPAGGLEAGDRRFNVKTSGDYESVQEIADTVVRSAAGSFVRVRDVADVELADEEPTDIARFDGKRAVLVAAAQKPDQNIFDVVKELHGVVDGFAATLPSSVALARGFDQSENVAHRLDGFLRDFGLAILLVLLTLLPLGVRASVVVMVSIPLSLAMGLFLLHVSGFSINQLSIVGFVIALGLLVDDSVVVVENIARHLRDGATPREAAVTATRQMSASVLGCTATLIFAFLPLLALPGVAGQFIRPMPLALVYTIIASLLVSLTIVPFLSSILLKSEGEHGNVFFRGMTHLIESSYRPLLGRAVANPLTTLFVALLLFGGALALVPRIGFSLFPKAGTPQFLIEIKASEGASLAATDRAARYVESVLRRHREVTRVATRVGKGHPQIYYNVKPRNEGANVADVFAEAHVQDATARSALYAALRRDFHDYPGAAIELREFENGPPLEAPIAMRLLGDDSTRLEEAAGLVEQVLKGTTGTRDVKNPSRDRRTDLKVAIDQEKAALLGVAIPDIDKATRLALAGFSVGRYRDDNAEEAYDVRMTLPRHKHDAVAGARADFEVLEQLYFPTASGRAVPFAQVAEVEFAPSPTSIRHYDKERSATVTAQVLDGYNTDRLTQEVLGKLASVKLPEGVRLVPAGELENRNESFGGLALAVLIAAFGVLAVLVLEFQTFKSTLIVASVIPLGVIGGLFALFLSGYTLSFTAIIGFVALMGIEVKNSILLVDFTNTLREQGLALDAAIQRAGEVRFVPILLTTLTAIGGLVPLALERSSLYSPLAIVIVGGLVSSTVLTRVVTPVMYKFFAPEIEVLSSHPLPAEEDDRPPQPHQATARSTQRMEESFSPSA